MDELPASLVQQPCLQVGILSPAPRVVLGFPGPFGFGTSRVYWVLVKGFKLPQSGSIVIDAVSLLWQLKVNPLTRTQFRGGSSEHCSVLVLGVENLLHLLPEALLPLEDSPGMAQQSQGGQAANIGALKLE